MNRLTKPAIAVGLVALTTLLFELTMIRVLDVLWYTHFSYMVITLALLGFGIAGVTSSVLSDKMDFDDKFIAKCAALFTFSFLVVYLVLDGVEVDFDKFDSFAALGFKVLIIYTAILLPFLFGGLILSAIFTRYASEFGKLYFVDLLFASAGVYLVPLLISKWGGPGLFFLAMAIAAIVWFMHAEKKSVRMVAALVGLIAFAAPLVSKNYIEINWHMDKRGFKSLEGGIVESRWDPISRIDIIRWNDNFDWIAYDGGTQTSYFYNDKRDFNAVRKTLPEDKMQPFWGRFVYAADWVKEGDLDRVLVIGAAGGQETRAALMFGAKEVDAIEMVGTVLQWGRDKYQSIVYQDPRVRLYRDEGRSFIRSTDRTYDLIQIMSNHTTSSIASGSGAVSPNYLLTVESFKEYFSHLTDDGILQINHHIYPKMAVTAARAWEEMGYNDFAKHLVIVENDKWLTLPTFLISMKPWTEAQLDSLRQVFNSSEWRFVQNPLEPNSSMITADMFKGNMSQEMAAKVPYNIDIPTDNRPYFNHLRSNWDKLSVSADTQVTPGVATILNRSLRDGIPMDVIHLFITAGIATLMAIVGLFLPLMITKTGRDPWKGKGSFMGYFACLGVGFISIELIFIQLFHKLIGFPIYTYATVIFAFLVSAGIGSLISDVKKLSDNDRLRWLPFIGIPLYGVILLALKTLLLDYFLGWSFPIRMLVTAVLIFPLGILMGMPFPMGIARSINISKGTVGWAWAINGLFTVIGSVFSVLASINIGFTYTLYIAFAVYVLAGWLLQKFGNEPIAAS